MPCTGCCGFPFPDFHLLPFVFFGLIKSGDERMVSYFGVGSALLRNKATIGSIRRLAPLNASVRALPHESRVSRSEPVPLVQLSPRTRCTRILT